MTTRIALVTLCLFAALSSNGCALFHRKPKDPAAPKSAKEELKSKTPVADMENSFRDRWIAKRAAELVAKGVAAEQANTQATSEYAEAYRYTKTAK